MPRFTLLLAMVLCLTPSGAHTQTTGVPADTRTAETAAARRLRELIAVIASGNTARIEKYLKQAYVPEYWQLTSQDRAVQWFNTLHDRTRGLELDSMRATGTEAAALVRSRLTGLREPLSVRVEPAPPHRIVGSASFSIEPPRHPLADPSARDAERVREIDRLARQLANVDAFSGVVLLARGDSILYLRAFGRADRERNVPMQTNTRFQLASLAKPFVTVAVAQLVEQGRISWDDPIGRF